VGLPADKEHLVSLDVPWPLVKEQDVGMFLPPPPAAEGVCGSDGLK